MLELQPPPLPMRLIEHATQRPSTPALVGGGRSITYGALVGEVAEASRRLASLDARNVALLADNGPAWAIADLGASVRGATLVPLPGFFTDEQLVHAVESAGIDVVLTDDDERVRRATNGTAVRSGEVAGLSAWCRPARDRPPLGCAKVTFTSGTTGTPKGVALSADAQTRVAHSAASVSQLRPGDRHLALLPLPILLENVAGLYRALVAGATTILPPLEDVGMLGSSACDPAAVVGALSSHRADSAILVPQVLDGVVSLCEQDPSRRPRRLRFLGVGGARVSGTLLRRAERIELPVFEGYGLSEAGSIVALNCPGALRLGSVGRVLPHAEVRIADDGEILVGGAIFDGYVGTGSIGTGSIGAVSIGPGSLRASAGLWPTGDLGHIDDDGFLFVHGRKRNVVITSYGRNVSPEWIEGLLTDGTSIEQAVIVGDGCAHLGAIVVCSGDSRDAVDAVERVNAVLPDYARIDRFVFADEPFSSANGLLDAKGVPRRSAVEHAYATHFENPRATPRDGAAVC